MKKVINITLGGIVFAIEDDAYTELSAYLKSIEAAFASSEDYAEISSDIEGAIAEKFLRAKKNEKRAVVREDVHRVISDMGQPEDFRDDESVHKEFPEQGADGNGQSNEKTGEEAVPRRFYRDTDSAVLGGVASGLGAYFNVDPVIVRIIFVVLIFLNGIGILAYVILWLIVPAAETTAQKYAMRGEKVTLSGISDRVKKKLSSIEPYDTKKVRGAWKSIRSPLAKFFEIFGTVVRTCLKILQYLIGILCIVGGAIGIAGVVSAASVLWFGEEWTVDFPLYQIRDVFFAEPSGYVLFCSAIISAIIPLIVVVMAGISLVVKKNIFTIAKSLTLGVLWIISFSLLGTFTVLYGPTAALRLERFENTYQSEMYGEPIPEVPEKGSQSTSTTTE